MPILAAPVLAAIIGGGATIGATALATHSAGNIASQQQQAAQAAQQRTAPAYNAAASYYQGLLSNPLQSPDIQNAQLQFSAARNNLINNAQSRGGGLDAGLANLEAGKASTISQLIMGGRQNSAAALGNLANSQQIAALQGLAGAQQSQTQNSILQSQALTGIGSFLTRLVAGGAFGNNNNNSGSNYFGVNMNNTNSGNIPAAVIPSTGQQFPGANEPFPSQV